MQNSLSSDRIELKISSIPLLVDVDSTLHLCYVGKNENRIVMQGLFIHLNDSYL